MTLRFEPAVYEHAAVLINCSVWKVSRNPEKMVEAHLAAYEIYHHNPVVAAMDIYNPEAEAFGAVVSESSGYAVPSIEEILCEDTAGILELPDFDPTRDGRLAMIIGAAVELRNQLPGTEVKVPVNGPFSLASRLCGLENLLCDCLTDPDTVSEALHMLIRNQARYAQCIREAGLTPTFFESAATPPLLPPELFASLVLPPLRQLVQDASCILGGNTVPILEDILSIGTRYVICPGETDQRAFMEIMRNHPQVMVRINMNPSVFCDPDPASALVEAERVMALAGDREKVCIGSGVLPPEAVPSTVLAVKKHVEQPIGV